MKPYFFALFCVCGSIGAFAAPVVEEWLAPTIYNAYPKYETAEAVVRMSLEAEHPPSPEWYCATKDSLGWPMASTTNCGLRYTGVIDTDPTLGTKNDLPHSWRIWYERYTLDGYVFLSNYLSVNVGMFCAPELGNLVVLSDTDASGYPAETYICRRSTPVIEPRECPDGNPIHASSGTKIQRERDFEGTGSNHLSFIRTYRSDTREWLSNYDAHAVDFVALNRVSNAQAGNLPESVVRGVAGPYPPYSSLPGDVFYARMRGRAGASENNFGLRRGNGQHVIFGSGTTEFQPPAGNNDRISRVVGGSGATTGFTVYNASNESTERFDTTGRLQQITFRTGQTHSLEYSDANTPISVASTVGKLIRVTDNFGHQISFAYDSKGRRSTMTDSLGGLYTYGYNEPSAFKPEGTLDSDMLTSVTYPDGKKRIYWYNEQDKTANMNLPYALTGITDENGDRFATFKYDVLGRAVSTEHAGGAEKISFGNITGAGTLVTDANGTTRAKRFTTIDNATYDAGQDQPGGSGCAASSNSIARDASGNITSRTDFTGSVTTYTYDMTRNLQTTMVVGSGTARAATTMTTWHPNFRLPTAVSEPLKSTTFSYDANGNLLSKTEQSTTDENGSLGFNAVLTGVAQTWNYTYNTLGQLLTAKSPRTDVVDQTTYAYDSAGNLSSLTTAAGLVTQFTQYDAGGRLLSMTDPKGIITAMTYTPRGWISTVSVTPPGGTARVTTYTYDNVGQVISVSNPDGTSIGYTYDAAHRLIGATDAKGNSVNYTLDNMGNRIAEQLKDPGGVLQRTMNRSFDALNRVQQLQLQ